MKDVIKVMAKELRRVRVLADTIEMYGAPLLYPTNQLETMRQMLALLIKVEQKG